MKNKKKYIVWALLSALVVYFSISIQPLSTYKTSSYGIDYKKMADDLYHNKIIKDTQTIALEDLKSKLRIDKEATFQKYGNRLGIGQSAFFMVKGSATITSITESTIELKDADGNKVSLATKFIFGNAIRDASNKVKLTDFKTNTEFNALSEALNDLIREKILPPKIASLQSGDRITYTGAIKFARNYDLPELVILSNIEKL